MEEVYTLLNGKKLNEAELTELHKRNLQNNTPPYTRYFCAECNYEVRSEEDGSFVCPNCEEIIE